MIRLLLAWARRWNYRRKVRARIKKLRESFHVRDY